MKTIHANFKSFDKWMCVFFPILSIRLWWCRLWIRKNEFHQSLDSDVDILLSFKGNKEKRDSYLQDLTKRRDIAHKKDFAL